MIPPTKFEEMIDEVVNQGISESAVVSNYFLIHYPYLQRISAGEVDGVIARSQLGESSPPGWRGTVKAMKKHREISNPFALAWSMKKQGAKSHYRSKAPFRKESD